MKKQNALCLDRMQRQQNAFYESNSRGIISDLEYEEYTRIQIEKQIEKEERGRYGVPNDEEMLDMMKPSHLKAQKAKQELEERINKIKKIPNIRISKDKK